LTGAAASAPKGSRHEHPELGLTP